MTVKRDDERLARAIFGNAKVDAELKTDAVPVPAGEHTPTPWETSVNSEQWDVCEAEGGNMIADLRGCDNAEANARLIVAAVNSHHAAEQLAEAVLIHDECSKRTSWDDVLKMARAFQRAKEGR